MLRIENLLRFLRISVGDICLLLEYPWRQPCVSIAGAEKETN